ERQAPFQRPDARDGLRTDAGHERANLCRYDVCEVARGSGGDVEMDCPDAIAPAPGRSGRHILPIGGGRLCRPLRRQTHSVGFTLSLLRSVLTLIPRSSAARVRLWFVASRARSIRTFSASARLR